MPALAVIPDIHMRRRLFEDAQALAADGFKLVFLGDYVDNGPIANDPVFLEEVFAFGRAEKAVMLIGNHDLAYLYSDREDFRQNGWEANTHDKLAKVYERYKSELNVAYLEDRYLFSHAGLSDSFLRVIEATYRKCEPQEVVDFLNDFRPPETFFCSPINGGHDALDGPLWLRLPSYSGAFEKHQLQQVVGHSSQSTIRMKHNLLMIDVQIPLLIEW